MKATRTHPAPGEKKVAGVFRLGSRFQTDTEGLI